MRERRSTACGIREPMSCLSTGPPARSSINIETLRRAKGTRRGHRPRDARMRALRARLRSLRTGPVRQGRRRTSSARPASTKRSRSAPCSGRGRRSTAGSSGRRAGCGTGRRNSREGDDIGALRDERAPRVAVRVRIAGPVERLRRPVQPLVPIIGEARLGVCGGGQAECQAGERAGDRGCHRLQCAPRPSLRYEGPDRMSRRAGAIKADAPGRCLVGRPWSRAHVPFGIDLH